MSHLSFLEVGARLISLAGNTVQGLGLYLITASTCHTVFRLVILRERGGQSLLWASVTSLSLVSRVLSLLSVAVVGCWDAKAARGSVVLTLLRALG
jgi:hypothetical protein